MLLLFLYNLLIFKLIYVIITLLGYNKQGRKNFFLRRIHHVYWWNERRNFWIFLWWLWAWIVWKTDQSKRSGKRKNIKEVKEAKKDGLKKKRQQGKENGGNIYPWISGKEEFYKIRTEGYKKPPRQKKAECQDSWTWVSLI